MRGCARAGTWALVVLIGFARAAATAAETPQDERALKDMSLEELMEVEIPTVYGASKHMQTIFQAPASVTIVTADEIRKRGDRTLADILRSVRGFYVTSDLGYEFVGLRGVNRPADYGGRVLVTVNGHRLNDPIFDQAFAGTDFILDVDLIERVEVIRGPGSALYGNNAFFAVVNVITRDLESLDGVEVAGSAASFDTFQGRATVGKRFANGFGATLSGTYWTGDGPESTRFPEFPEIDGGTSRHPDSLDVESVYGRFSYGPFAISGAAVHRGKNLVTGAYGTYLDADNEITDERAYARAELTQLLPYEWQLEADLYYDHYRYRGKYFYALDETVPPPLSQNDDLTSSQSAGIDLQLGRTVFEHHRITTGLEYRRAFSLRQLNRDVDPPYETYADTDNDQDMLGVYVQDEYSILSGLQLSAGLRLDYFSTFGVTVNPRIALVYAPWESSAFKAIYGTAFRAPNAYELYYQGPYYVANRDLEPERIRSYELVYEQILLRDWYLTSLFFYNQIDDLITFVPVDDENFSFINTESVDVVGGEVEIGVRTRGGWNANASYSYAHTEDNETGLRLTNSPASVGKLNLIAPLVDDRLFVGVELQAMSSRKTVQGGETDGFVLANATLFGAQILPHTDFSVSVYNLFDERYADPVSDDFVQETIEQIGRTFRVKLLVRF